MERTLVLIKPDAFHRALVGRCISRLEEKGLQLIGAKLIWLDDEVLNKQYQHLSNQSFFEEIKQFMKNGPVLATVWEGVDSVQTVRRLCGITKAREAEPGTIRGDWAMSVMCNLVHSSDSIENVEKELPIFFKESEIVYYERIDMPFLYSKRENPKIE
jgi:nucleoside-diphosphate kinase